MRILFLLLAFATPISAQPFLTDLSVLETSLTTQADVARSGSQRQGEPYEERVELVMDVVFSLVNPTDSVALLRPHDCLLRLRLTSEAGYERPYCFRSDYDWYVGPGGEHRVSWRMHDVHLPPAPRPGPIRALVSSSTLSIPSDSTTFFGQTLPDVAIRFSPRYHPRVEGGTTYYPDSLAVLRFIETRTDIERTEAAYPHPPSEWSGIWYAAPDKADSLIAQANRSGLVRATDLAATDPYALGRKTYRSDGYRPQPTDEEKRERRRRWMPPPPYAVRPEPTRNLLLPDWSPPLEDKWDRRDYQSFGWDVADERPVVLIMHDQIGTLKQQHTFYPVDGKLNLRYYEDTLSRGLYRIQTLGSVDPWEQLFGPSIHAVRTDIEELEDGTFRHWSSLFE